MHVIKVIILVWYGRDNRIHQHKLTTVTPSFTKRIPFGKKLLLQSKEIKMLQKIDLLRFCFFIAFLPNFVNLVFLV